MQHIGAIEGAQIYFGSTAANGLYKDTEHRWHVTSGNLIVDSFVDRDQALQLYYAVEVAHTTLSWATGTARFSGEAVQAIEQFGLCDFCSVAAKAWNDNGQVGYMQGMLAVMRNILFGEDGLVEGNGLDFNKWRERASKDLGYQEKQPLTEQDYFGSHNYGR